MKKLIIACCLTLIPLSANADPAATRAWERQGFIEQTFGSLPRDAARASRFKLFGDVDASVGYNQGNRAPFRSENPTADRMYRSPGVAGIKLGLNF